MHRFEFARGANEGADCGGRLGAAPPDTSAPTRHNYTPASGPRPQITVLLFVFCENVADPYLTVNHWENIFKITLLSPIFSRTIFLIAFFISLFCWVVSHFYTPGF